MIDWTQTYVPRQEARAKLRLELDEALSNDESACLEMKHKNAGSVRMGSITSTRRPSYVPITMMPWPR